MGSIPLPALDLQRPIPQADPLEQYGRLMQLRNQQQMAPLQMQQAQQQVQTGGLELQQKQQQLTDQKAMTSAMQDWDGKDYNSIIPLVVKNGGSAQAVMGLKKNILDQQTQISTAAKNNAQATSAQVEATMKKNDLVTGSMAPLLDPQQTPDAQLPQALAQTVQSLTQQGLLDPQHAQQASQLAQSGDPTAIRNGITQFSNTLMAHSQIVESALKQAQTGRENAETGKIKAATDPNSILYSPSQAAVAMGTAPGSAQIQAGEVRQAAAKAGAEESARMPGEMALAAQRQALSQGNPNAAAQLLVNGDATLSELKSRGATPEFIANTLNAAHKLSNGQYNAQSADAQFSVAKSPANVAFFGSAKSLTDPGGTLDQLAKIGAKIPGNQIPAFNSISDWEKAATGSGPLAQYASTALGVADDYSKVMGGGQGSDTSRLQALNLIKSNASPEARSAAIQGIRGAVSSQTNSRIGSNPVLGRMYGAPNSPTDGLTVTAPNGKTYTFKDQQSADNFKAQAGIH
jgi:hypothetical protein